MLSMDIHKCSKLRPCMGMKNTKVRTVVTGERGNMEMKVSERQLYV